MARLSATTFVHASPDLLFRMVEAPVLPLLPVKGPRLVRPGQMSGPGAVYRWEFRRLGLNFRVDSVVTDYRPGERIAFQGTSGWEMEAEVNLHPEAEGTRLTFHMRYRFPVPVSWLVPGPLIRLGVWHALRQLKAMTEQEAHLVFP